MSLVVYSEIVRLGQTAKIGIFVTDEDSVAINLTTSVHVIYMGFKAVPEDSGHLLLLSTSSGITNRTQSGDDIGWADATLTEAQTTALGLGRFVFDVWPEPDGGEAVPIIGVSRLIIVSGVTEVP